MENEQEKLDKDRVTIRIEEGAQQTGPTQPVTAESDSKETKVVMIRDSRHSAACYYEGWHDGQSGIWFLYASIFCLSFALAYFVLKYNAAE